MMIRLMGTKEELTQYKNHLLTNFNDLILDISGFYPNRGASKLGRMYITTKEIHEGSLEIETQKELTLPDQECH